MHIGFVCAVVIDVVVVVVDVAMVVVIISMTDPVIIVDAVIGLLSLWS